MKKRVKLNDEKANCDVDNKKGKAIEPVGYTA